jgi:hypothetical protein
MNYASHHPIVKLSSINILFNQKLNGLDLYLQLSILDALGHTLRLSNRVNDALDSTDDLQVHMSSKETYLIVFYLYNCLYIPLTPLFSPNVEKYKIHIVSRSPYQTWLITRHTNDNILPVNERRRFPRACS